MNINFDNLREIMDAIPDDLSEEQETAALIELAALMGLEMAAEIIAMGITLGVLEEGYHNGILDEFLAD